MTGTTDLPSLAGAEWLTAPGVAAIFAALDRDGEETRIVGGAVRNALMGRPVRDVIDFGTTATPDVVAGRANAAGIKVVPTGVDHGTLTLVTAGAAHEVTTLREDVETDGRHAVVRFGRDWTADARRRDFTLNALSVDHAGTVHDPIGGYADLVAGRVRFIGDPDQRIAEDRLRILRFFRIHAQYGSGELDRAGLAATIRTRDGVRALSGERVGAEMRRLVVAPRAGETLTAMQDAGILTIVLAGVGFLGPFAKLAEFEAEKGTEPAPALRLAALGARVSEDVLRLAERLRLSNAERDRMASALTAASGFAGVADLRAARRLLYGVGVEAYRDGLAMAAAWGALTDGGPSRQDLSELPEAWLPPVFPLDGNDVIAAGGERGKAVGDILRAIEAWWIEHDFAPDETALRQRLQQIVAMQQ